MSVHLTRQFCILIHRQNCRVSQFGDVGELRTWRSVPNSEQSLWELLVVGLSASRLARAHALLGEESGGDMWRGAVWKVGTSVRLSMRHHSNTIPPHSLSSSFPSRLARQTNRRDTLEGRYVRPSVSAASSEHNPSSFLELELSL